MLNNLKKLTLVLGLVACCQYSQASDIESNKNEYIVLQSHISLQEIGIVSVYSNLNSINNETNLSVYDNEHNYDIRPMNYDIIHPNTNDTSFKMNKKEQKIIDKLIKIRNNKSRKQFVIKDQNKRFDHDHFGKTQKKSKQHITK